MGVSGTKSIPYPTLVRQRYIWFSQAGQSILPGVLVAVCTNFQALCHTLSLFFGP